MRRAAALACPRVASLPDVSDMWRRNHPWAAIYSFGIDHPALARPPARLGFGTDIDLLYAAADEIGDLPEGAAVLDVPCGSGVALRGVRPGQDVRYVAADISPAMLERTERQARERGIAGVECLTADVAALPFADGEFDLCVSFTGLHCFPDPHAALLEIGRVIRPGGRLSASWFRTDAGVRYAPAVLGGRAMGVMGPSAGVDEVRAWSAEAGLERIEIVASGALAYLKATRAG